MSLPPNKWSKKTITLKIWQFILSLVGAVFAGMILLTCIAFALAPVDTTTAPQTDTTASDSSTQSEQSTDTNKETPKPKSITSISAEYNGPTTAGTEINDQSDIDVTVVYSDDTHTNNVRGFTVKNPGTLEAGQTQEFTVEYKGHEATFTVNVEESDDQFKASTQDISYEELARNPDANKYKRVHFRGKIVQVMEDELSVQYRISVEQTDYGSWDSNKVIYVTYIRTGNDNRLLEDDIVELWGTSNGTITYESTLGGHITIPSVVARIMQLSS
ncbi:tcdA-E operon negative regulator [Bifidobacterium goeldii]|uniref:TcdA-E operon negative regulator n=1 Tax=Bifidobacterium goeldii TaxID=2306975 RepID=A0A430FH04_9BIFI|nr:hypothetical protein [Bifidobacterium goeldii]RSX52154.1 tcdA-E operon negative regulator [Bifidobacterium goeldii]